MENQPAPVPIHNQHVAEDERYVPYEVDYEPEPEGFDPEEFLAAKRAEMATW